MQDVDLLTLAMSLRDAHKRLSALVRTSLPQAAPLADEETLMLEQLVDSLRAREERLGEVKVIVADRLNNVLMAVKTASDLLRTQPSVETTAVIRQRLDATVETGRDALKRINGGLARLR